MVDLIYILLIQSNHFYSLSIEVGSFLVPNFFSSRNFWGSNRFWHFRIETSFATHKNFHLETQKFPK